MDRRVLLELDLLLSALLEVRGFLLGGRPDLFLQALPVLACLVEDVSGVVLGLVHHGLVTSQESLGVGLRLLRFLNGALDVPLTLGQRRHQGLPRDRAKHQEDDHERDDRPDEQSGIHAEEIR